MLATLRHIDLKMNGALYGYLRFLPLAADPGLRRRCVCGCPRMAVRAPPSADRRALDS